MGRPKLTLKRDQQLNLRFTPPEYEEVKTRAETYGLRPIDYGRAVLLNERREFEATRPVGTIERLWLAQVRRLGNNLNQMMRHLHMTKEPAPPTLALLLDEIRELLRRSRTP